MENSDEIIKQNVLNRELLIELIITAIFISFGTNLIVSSFFNINNIINIVFLVIGLIIVFCSSNILIYKNFKKFNRDVLIEGFLVYNSKKNELVDIDNYPLSQDVNSNLNAAFKEEKSLQKIWDSIPLNKVFKFTIQEKVLKTDQYETSAKEIIEELVEYYFLHTLSTTLTDFFNKSNFKEEKLKKYERNDIPDVLLNNRFLNLFSKPMVQREAFVEDYINNTNNNKETGQVIASGKNGFKYQKFDLILPKKTSIKRLEHHKIILESEQMTIKFTVIFKGCNVVLPIDFEKYYLGLNFDPSKFHDYAISLKVDINFKFRSLFSNEAWNYHMWLDKYLDTLKKDISMNQFFESINWKQIRALLYILEKKKFQEDIKK